MDTHEKGQWVDTHMLTHSARTHMHFIMDTNTHLHSKRSTKAHSHTHTITKPPPTHFIKCLHYSCFSIIHILSFVLIFWILFYFTLFYYIIFRFSFFNIHFRSFCYNSFSNFAKDGFYSYLRVYLNIKYNIHLIYLFYWIIFLYFV